MNAAGQGRDHGRVLGKSLEVLVATTVIEVGVNVPNANIMVIEHAERFGLAHPSVARTRRPRLARKLLHAAARRALGRDRGRAPRHDVRDRRRLPHRRKGPELRGGGEVLGARQSGMPEFRVADVPGFQDLLAAARDDAQMVLNSDPNLSSPRGRALRFALYLFECDEAVRLFRAGWRLPVVPARDWAKGKLGSYGGTETRRNLHGSPPEVAGDDEPWGDAGEFERSRGSTPELRCPSGGPLRERWRGLRLGGRRE